MLTRQYSISDIKGQPQFFAITADRIWRAWWKSQGYDFEFIKGLMEENRTTHNIPVALIAHDGDEFLGTVSLIASDLSSRPDYSPWVAALWVDEPYRSRGIGSTLVTAAIQIARDQQFETVYLGATSDKHEFYVARGWLLSEKNIEGLNIYHQIL